MIEKLLLISHGINIVFAGSLGILLLIKHPSLEKNFGWDSPSRQMFASIYLTIMIASLFAVVFRTFIADVALILFPIQIVYSVLSILTVGQKRNPMIWINLILSFLFAFTFISLFNF
jgi:hypothetical protein